MQNTKEYRDMYSWDIVQFTTSAPANNVKTLKHKRFDVPVMKGHKYVYKLYHLQPFITGRSRYGVRAPHSRTTTCNNQLLGRRDTESGLHILGQQHAITSYWDVEIQGRRDTESGLHILVQQHAITSYWDVEILGRRDTGTSRY